ncbi:MAG: DUF1353 domain-containing protein [bacterium]|nr:DUF1353 domain-containing protein [bacterium]
MSNHGSFSGNPKTEWTVDDNGEDRNMVLLEDFSYIDPDGKKWNAPKGSVVNGASIPRPLWSTVGSPYTDDYRRASVVHDVACNSQTIPRKDADVMFYHACLAGGCSYSQANLLYAGVRVGAWSIARCTSRAFTKESMLFQIPPTPSSDEKSLQNTFQTIASELKGLSDEASIDVLDAVINKHVKF